MKLLSAILKILVAATFWVVALPFLGVGCITAGAWILLGTGPGLMVLGCFLIGAGMLVARAMRVGNG
jgi:hypothetical protein